MYVITSSSNAPPCPERPINACGLTYLRISKSPSI